MNSAFTLKRILPKDDLIAVAASVMGSKWGKDNEMEDYDELAIREFVADTDNVLLIAYADSKPAGTALATRIRNPYKGKKDWFYIDELDVHPDYRRRGIAKMLMEELFEIAKSWGLKEAWLGTEPDNQAANELYKSLEPSEIENFIGYTYKLKVDEN